MSCGQKKNGLFPKSGLSNRMRPRLILDRPALYQTLKNGRLGELRRMPKKSRKICTKQDQPLEPIPTRLKLKCPEARWPLALTNASFSDLPTRNWNGFAGFAPPALAQLPRNGKKSFFPLNQLRSPGMNRPSGKIFPVCVHWPKPRRATRRPFQFR